MFTCHVFLINFFEGRLHKILRLDYQRCSIDMQMIVEISMDRYLKIQSCIFTAICTYLAYRLRSSSFAVICTEKWGKMMLGDSKLSRNKWSVSAGGGKRSFPITMVNSWRSCWILSAGSILFHEHPMLTREEVTKYTF